MFLHFSVSDDSEEWTYDDEDQAYGSSGQMAHLWVSPLILVCVWPCVTYQINLTVRLLYSLQEMYVQYFRGLNQRMATPTRGESWFVMRHDWNIFTGTAKTENKHYSIQTTQTVHRSIFIHCLSRIDLHLYLKISGYCLILESCF